MKNELLTSSVFTATALQAAGFRQNRSQPTAFQYIYRLFPQLPFQHFPPLSEGNATDSFITGEHKTHFSSSLNSRVINKSGPSATPPADRKGKSAVNNWNRSWYQSLSDTELLPPEWETTSPGNGICKVLGLLHQRLSKMSKNGAPHTSYLLHVLP